MENQIKVDNQNMQQIEQNEVSQTKQTQKKSNSNYLFIVIVVLICFAIFGIGEYYLKTQRVFQNPQSVVISPTPATTTKTSSVITPINANLKTYKDVKHKFTFDYPQNYVITTNSDCSSLINNQSNCLLSLTLNPTDNDYIPKAYFWLLQGISYVNISGQVSGITFDSRKKIWVLSESSSEPQAGQPIMTKALPVWSRTKSGQEIIKFSNGGSHGSSYYYLIPNYKDDKVALFSVPQSYRLRCDNFTNNKSKETNCNNFYKYVINQYNRGEKTPDTWLPENYLSSIYSEAENIVKSYKEITK